MSAEEILAGAPVWIRRTFAQRNGTHGKHARETCRAWIACLRWARKQAEGNA